MPRKTDPVTATVDARFLAAFHALPDGTHTGRYQTRRYVWSKSTFNTGKSWKLVAEELGGSDYISLNLYALASGTRLYPCEMPAAKVTAFIRGLVIEN
ncbi:hypothetical protein SAMN04488512_102224 [Sulfitobacter litoralis]|uniref:Peptide-methionine (S)-S-oxide reductase n=1 Tax=Sulfitobacter litoralis TaxID=335975 RepID=A0ABY0RQ69_9RHOB|nr:hypothetical protein SAMN04488512_102224 [Sulfitobacter litoralis]